MCQACAQCRGHGGLWSNVKDLSQLLEPVLTQWPLRWLHWLCVSVTCVAAPQSNLQRPCSCCPALPCPPVLAVPCFSQRHLPPGLIIKCLHSAATRSLTSPKHLFSPSLLFQVLCSFKILLKTLVQSHLLLCVLDPSVRQYLCRFVPKDPGLG